MRYLAAALNSTHKKKNFDCGNALLNNYLLTQAKQDVKRELAACFILEDAESNVKGYYTLSSTAIRRESLSENIIKKLPPSYKDLPAILLGRLAVDNTFKGQGIGKLVLIDALKRSFDTSILIGSIAVVVNPIDEDATKFYTRYGFILLPDSGKMFIAMETVSALF